MARSSVFCTSTAERARRSSRRSSSVNAERATRNLALSLVNIVPSPVMALRHSTGVPAAASEPTTVAGKAT
jgi:hypothetical protein